MVNEKINGTLITIDSANLSVEAKLLHAILITEREVLAEIKRNRQAYQKVKKNEHKHEQETPGNNNDK